MIAPLFLEQLLVMFVGLADTLVISYAGEAAVSGVSLVNQFNTIFIYLFTALASGGAVVISQYIGRQDMNHAGEAASQLLMFSAAFSILLGAAVLLGKEAMLRLLFGKVEPPVMEACITYLRISAYSYPALAVYNAGAAVYRSLGKTNVTMYISVASNGINVIGNVLGVFVFHAGVAMGPVFITVIGQCMGTGNTEAAESYFKKLTKLTLLISAAWNALVFLVTPVFLHFYSLSPETKRLVVWLVLIHNVFNAAAYPFSGALSNGLRAAGDVKFTMYVSVISTVAVRLLLSYLLGITLRMGVIGIALAMVCDWICRAVLFIWRERTGKWKTFQIIKQ
ncbi:MAG: MATE family efflux transporter [Lachnospiraceae bacterium]|nr:MATE family efflux transporter [Lachnospiraceae bacterium]